MYSSVYNLYTTYIYKRYIHIIHYSYTILCMSIFKYLLKMTLSLSECYIVLPNHMSMWKVQFFRKTIIRSTISHYDFYTNKSLLGGRSAQFVAQFYNKRNNKKNRLSIIAYRNRSHLELRQLETVCEFANCAGRGRGLGERQISEDMTPTHIYISSWSKSMDGKGFKKTNARL